MKTDFKKIVPDKAVVQLSSDDEKIFREKMMDLYNFCAERKVYGGAINFADGCYFECALVVPQKPKDKLYINENGFEGDVKI